MTVTSALEKILSDSYALYFKTQNYHWNVRGAGFRSLHLLFEAQYKELNDAIDEVAERIRMIGMKVSKISEIMTLSTLSEATPDSSSYDMLKDLADDQEMLISTLMNGLRTAQKFGDEGTADMIIQRIKTHQKNRWMLISSLDN